MRIKNTIRNGAWALICQIAAVLLGFINRVIVIRLLGIEYAGVNGLFTDILNLLSIAEMGIGYAVMYEMYKPMHFNDTKALHGLVFYYQKIYTKIGLLVCTAGFIITPFLFTIAPDAKPIPYIKAIYIVFVLNTSVIYFFASKRSLLNAAQKNYIEQIVSVSFLALQFILQFICLIFTKNYLLFAFCRLVCTLLSSCTIILISKKLFPFVASRQYEGLDQSTRRRIGENIRALFISNISGVVFSATDSLIISNFRGLAELGVFTNYTLIVNYLNTIIRIGINAVMASIGDLNAEKEISEVYIYYKRVLFLIYIVISIFCICFYILCNDFIMAVFGYEYILSKGIILLLTVNMYIVNIRLPSLVFRNAMGIFKYDKYKGIPEIIINLIISVILVRPFGIFGVLLGTTISMLIVSFWIESFMLYKHGFNKPFFHFIKYNFKYISISVLGFFICVAVCSFIKLTGITAFFVKASICLPSSIAIILIWFLRTDEFVYYRNHAIAFARHCFKRDIN